jgi:hypothetical protein
MTRARGRAIFGIVALLIIAAASLAYALRRQPAASPSTPAAKPVLLLLTTLPLMFGEDFSLEGGGSPALTALQAHYRVIPISTTDGSELAKGRLLLMAHPQAQTAENLVVLDSWVQRGGRVMILADPMLEWPSERPLGDPLRPPPMFADTGLLGHWGLRLFAPDQRGRKAATLGGYPVVTESPGELEGEGSCAVSKDRLAAHCRIGEGRATIIADADLLDVADLGNGADHNLDAMLSELSELHR